MKAKPDVSWEGHQSDPDKIRYYIKLMVEGSTSDIGHRDWAPVPALLVH
jgi:hypothetical protein